MIVFVAYTEKGAPVGISDSKENTIKRIKEIEHEYKYSTLGHRLIGRKYFIQEVQLVPDKLDEKNIIRTIPKGERSVYESN